MHQNHRDQHRQHILEIRLDPPGHLEAVAGVALGSILVKAPAPFGDTEQKIHQTAARQQQVADEEILEIQHRAVCAHGLDKAPHIVAQRTGQTQQHQRRRAHDAGFVAVPAKVLAGAGDDVFKHCNDRGEAGEGHEQKEQCTPQAAACHVRKDVGQGNKNQARACVG